MPCRRAAGPSPTGRLGSCRASRRAATPRLIVDRLNAETRKALQEASVGQQLVDIGGEARGSTPDEMKAMLVTESDRWGRLVTEADIPRN